MVLLRPYSTYKRIVPYILAAAARDRDPCSTTGATFHFTEISDQSHVAAAKYGIYALSACAASENGPRGVTSNIIALEPWKEMNGFKDFRAKLRESPDKLPAISRWEDTAFSMKFRISPCSFSVKRIMTSMTLC